MWEAKGGPGLAPAAPGRVLSSWRNRKDSKRLEGGGVTAQRQRGNCHFGGCGEGGRTSVLHLWRDVWF